MTAFAVAMMSREVTVKADKARRELGYAPAVGVEEGLAGVRATPRPSADAPRSSVGQSLPAA